MISFCPLEMTTRIEEPVLAFVPALGFWLMTRPRSVSSFFVDSISIVKSEYSADLEMVRSAVFSDGPDREQRIRTAFDTLLGKLHISASDILRIWDTVRAYAEYKNIPLLVARKLVLPYLLELVVEGTEVDGRISAITISQFITGIMEKIGIDSGATLEEILARLMNTLGSL